MPISKKDRISREHKKAEAAGTRVPVNPNGTPKKPAKEKSICVFCRKELARDNKKILEYVEERKPCHIRRRAAREHAQRRLDEGEVLA
ncbi:uncharacterized protein LTR77_005294 [Saxophila tyrrhenica]|uniref:Uncharacterized protein n=1 Tax=Saxophila tyrrhenica TaxID=1690608 RepID=A0AAV9P828_9PEZI|nr:hypothetical protein LTR77_005294 [Saxophila tyrrhenica]